MALVIKAPNSYDAASKYTIFLAGSIDMGRARAWHEDVIKGLADLDILILSPKRDDWDASWEQCRTCEPFREQVLWENDAMAAADMIVFCMTAESKAPITMYEYGRYASLKECIVCVEEGFYRQGNFDIYAELDKVPMYHDLDEMISDLQTVLREKV